MCLRCETAAVFGRMISLCARRKFQVCKGRWFPVSSRTQVETQATHLATAKDARSMNAAVQEYVVGRGGDFG